MTKGTSTRAAGKQSREVADPTQSLIDGIRQLARICVAPEVWKTAVLSWHPAATLSESTVVTKDWAKTYDNVTALMRSIARNAWSVIHAARTRGHAHPEIERLHKELETLLRNPQSSEAWSHFDILTIFGDFSGELIGAILEAFQLKDRWDADRADGAPDHPDVAPIAHDAKAKQPARVATDVAHDPRCKTLLDILRPGPKWLKDIEGDQRCNAQNRLSRRVASGLLARLRKLGMVDKIVTGTRKGDRGPWRFVSDKPMR